MGKETLRHVINAEGEELVKLADRLDLDALQDLTERIAACPGAVFFTGCGTSAQAARKITHTFQVIGQRAFFLDPADAVHGGLGAVHEGDIVIIISKGGTTKELLSFVPNLQEKRVTIVGVGDSADAPLGQASDVFVKVKVDREPDAFNMLATASTAAVVATFDAVAINLMNESGFSKQAFLVNHPSGDVGTRLAEGRT